MAARFITNDTKETPLSNNEKIAQMLGLQADANEVSILTALKVITDKIASTEAKLIETEKSLAALKSQEPPKAQAALSQSTDVPLEAVKAMQVEFAALKAQVIQSEVAALVSQGLKDGRLSTALEPWARDLGASNIGALKGFLSQTRAHRGFGRDADWRQGSKPHRGNQA